MGQMAHEGCGQGAGVAVVENRARFQSLLITRGLPLAVLSGQISLFPCPAYLALTFSVSGYVF